MKDIKDLYTELFLNHHLMSIHLQTPGLALTVSQSHKAPELPGMGSNCYPNFAGVSSPSPAPSPVPPSDFGIRRHVPTAEREGEGVRAPVAIKGVDSRFLGGGGYQNVYKYTLFQGTVINFGKQSEFPTGLAGAVL